jgi:hypothetical protein
MKRLFTRVMLAFASLVLLSPVVHAQAFRTYLASYGSDANPCTVALPCRLLPAAINAVAPKGEIWILDSANFNTGTVTIGKNVNIRVVPGEIGSILAVGGVPGIILSPGVTVSMRNVAIGSNALNPGTHGIQMTTGVLTVEDSVFNVTGGRGVYAIGTGGTVSVHNSVFRNGGGVTVADGAVGDISDSKFSNVGSPVVVEVNVANAPGSANVVNCRMTGGFAGAWLRSQTTGASGTLNVINSSISNSTFGIRSDVLGGSPSLVVSVSGTDLSNNGVGLYQNGTGAVLESLSNNLVRNNGSNSSGTITPVGAM